MATKVGDIVQVVRFHEGQKVKGSGRGKVTARDDDTFTVQWGDGSFGYLQAGFDQWINLSSNPPKKDLSKDQRAGRISGMQEALLGRRRR